MMKEGSDRDLGKATGHWTQKHAHDAHGPLGHLKERAVQAFEGVVHAVEHVVHPHPTAQERTGEDMHMAKAAEGRNTKEDDSITRALHEALKPERGEVRGPATSFPETLDQAIFESQSHNPEVDRVRAAAELAAAEEAAGGAAGGGPPEPPAFARPARSKL